MNLLDLLNFCGNLLDYDPVNETYREQLVSLLNDAQSRLLTEKHWAFAQRERELEVYADVALTLIFAAGSNLVTAPAGTVFPFAVSTVKPGSSYELADMDVTYTDAGGETVTETYQIVYVVSTSTLRLNRKFSGPSGTYSCVVKRREVYLPSDATNVMSVLDPTQGIPRPSIFLSKFERDDVALDPDLSGTVEAYLPSKSIVIPAPQTARGITTVSGVSQGVRTINVYMVNVMGPRSQNYPSYRTDCSNGFESSFSKVSTFTLAANQTLEFTPETLDDRTGLYRRYYFTCPEANILAPVRVRNANDNQGAGPAVSTDTVPPQGGMTLKPDLSLTTLQSQVFQSRSIRYFWGNSAAYRAVQLYPHPSADQKLTVRTVIAPERMQEDQDSPLIPADYSQVIAYAALESLTLKVDNAALAQVYERKKTLMLRGMAARYLAEVPRRIVKGVPTAGYRYMTNPFGTLKFTP